MKLRVGTSGFGYKEWRGHFYPEDLSSDDFLSFYAQHFDIVERFLTHQETLSTLMQQSG